MHERHGVVVFDLDVITGLKFQATDVPSVTVFPETCVFSIIFDLIPTERDERDVAQGYPV